MDFSERTDRFYRFNETKLKSKSVSGDFYISG